MEYHEPVLLQPAIGLLVTNPDGVYVDGTLGGGGHSFHLLQSAGPECRCIGFDVDPVAIAFASARLKTFGSRFTAIQSNTALMEEGLYRLGIRKVDGILLDLGVSSRQLDDESKGFTFRKDTRLDLRLDPSLPETAESWINTRSFEEIDRVLRENGEEPYSRKVASAIIKAREKGPVLSTGALTDIIDTVIFPDKRKKTYARVFQAIRMEINKEIDRLKEMLQAGTGLLKPGGRLVVISYHSLEDRMVKTWFRDRENPCTCPPGLPVCICGKKPELKVLTRKAVMPDDEELKTNPRSRSARLRAAEKC